MVRRPEATCLLKGIDAAADFRWKECSLRDTAWRVSTPAFPFFILPPFPPFPAAGMTALYGADPAATEAESLRTIDKALELGINFLDTAWIYQHGPSGETNEALVSGAGIPRSNYIDVMWRQVHMRLTQEARKGTEVYRGLSRNERTKGAMRVHATHSAHIDVTLGN